MRNIIILLLMMIASTGMLMAQSISGNTAVSTGSSQSYTYGGPGVIMNPQWRMSNNKGTITSQTQSGSSYTAVITWNTAGSETLAFLDGLVVFALLASINVFLGIIQILDPKIGYKCQEGNWSCNQRSKILYLSWVWGSYKNLRRRFASCTKN